MEIETFNLLQEVKELVKSEQELIVKVNKEDEHTIAILKKCEAMIYLSNLLQLDDINSIIINLKKSD